MSNPKFILNKKSRYLRDIRHEIKKKRIFFDESKERLGLDELSQLTKVRNTSEVKGYPFKGSKQKYQSVTRGIEFGIKIVPIETKYEKFEHPSNIESLVLKELTDNIIEKNVSPHIVYFLGQQKITNKSRAFKMLNLKRLETEQKIRTHSNMLISEFVHGGSLDNWIFETYENDKEISDIQWKNIVFQLVYTIAIIQKHYKMMHNDFHYGNILIDDSIQPGGYLVYTIDDKTFYLKNTGIIPKIWDFEFSMVYSDKIKESYPNKFIIGPYHYDRKNHKTLVDLEKEGLKKEDLNVPFNYNQVYDVHYFLTSLLDLYISQELFDWIVNLYPADLIPEDTSSTDKSSTNDSSTTDESPSTDDSSSTNSDLSESSSSVSSSSVPSSVDSSSSGNEEKYLCEGRLINGVEELFDLPTPLELINSDFFKSFTIKPADFDENNAIYFN
jgi:hypothetical protein